MPVGRCPTGAPVSAIIDAQIVAGGVDMTSSAATDVATVGIEEMAATATSSPTEKPAATEPAIPPEPAGSEEVDAFAAWLHWGDNDGKSAGKSRDLQ